MPAYVIFLREDPIHDPAEMAEYDRLRQQVTGDWKMTPLVVYGEQQAIEGKAPDGSVILQFPTMEDARAWYFTSGYQEAAAHRQKGANYRGFIVDGFSMG